MADQTIERMVVDGSPARCFEVVADIESYPQWVADLKEVHVNERDQQGTAFPCLVPGGCFRAQHELHPCLRLCAGTDGASLGPARRGSHEPLRRHISLQVCT